MLEFLIKRTDGDRFDLPDDLLELVLKPASFACEAVSGWGARRIRIEGCEVTFSLEDPGIQIAFDGDIEIAVAARVAQEIRDNVERATGQRGAVVEI